MVCALLSPSFARAQPLPSLIKGSESAVYLAADDGKRYVFPNASIFKSWYPESATVMRISDEALAAIPLGGNVMYRPGFMLVKITTDPRVYAVSRYGVLRWITSEALATTLYGSHWNANVVDIPDVFFTNYLIGSPIVDASSYTIDTELRAAQMPQQNIRPASFVPPVSPVTPAVRMADLTTILSTSQAVLNQNVSVFATVNTSSLPIARIHIRAESSPNILTTCFNTMNCSYLFPVTTAPMTERYFAEAVDIAGNKFQTPSSGRPTLTVNSASDQIQISATPLISIVGSRVSFSSDATRLGSVLNHKIYALIPGETKPVLWKDCGATNYCAGSTPFYRTNSLYSQITVGGQMLTSAAILVQVVGGDPPKATLTVKSRPAKNQIQIDVNAPFGEMINTTALVDGTTIGGNTLALCQGSCSVILQVNVPGSITAFTWVGGAYERSNTITVTPE